MNHGNALDVGQKMNLFTQDKKRGNTVHTVFPLEENYADIRKPDIVLP